MSDEGGKSSWLEPLPEEYANNGDLTGRRMVGAVLTVIVLAIFGGLIWYSYLDGNGNGPVPVVHADNSVVKEKPETPGGLQVPNQDKRVFDRVSSTRPANGAELAASAELPVDRPVDSKIIVATKQQIARTEQNSPRTEEIAKPAAAAPDAGGTIGDYLVQLGAFGKLETATQLWKKLQMANAVLLRGLGPDIMMIDLGKKGVLYRLRGGMISDRASADKICGALKAKKHACIVVKK